MIDVHATLAINSLSSPGPLVYSRQMPARACKRRASAPERYVVCSRTPHRREKKPSSTSREEERQVNHGCTDWQALDSDLRGLSPLSLSECTLGEVVEGGRNTDPWAGGCSSLEEEEDADADMFPPDWTPPRVDFLYFTDLPVLSPAPGLVSESQSSVEMPDSTEEPMERSAEAASSIGDNSSSLEEVSTLQTRSIQEFGTGNGADPERSAPLVYGAADKQQEECSLVDPTQGESQNASSPGQSPLLSPVPPQASSSTICSSNISASSDEFEGDTESLAFQLHEDLGPECPQLPSPIRPLSRCRSLSSSSDELSVDPGSLAVGSDMEEDVSDCDLISLSDLFEMRSVASQSTVELKEVGTTPGNCITSCSGGLPKCGTLIKANAHVGPPPASPPHLHAFWWWQREQVGGVT